MPNNEPRTSSDTPSSENTGNLLPNSRQGGMRVAEASLASLRQGNDIGLEWNTNILGVAGTAKLDNTSIHKQMFSS